MAATMLSQDMVSVCLQLSDCNLDIELTDLYARLSKYEEENNCHFGISEGDFAGSIRTLLLCELGFSVPDVLDDTLAIKLKDIIPEMLRFHSAYFKDTEDYWVRDNEVGKMEIQYLFGYDDEEYDKKVKIRFKMIDFFCISKEESISSESVKAFLEANNISETVFGRCTRSGQSS